MGDIKRGKIVQLTTEQKPLFTNQDWMMIGAITVLLFIAIILSLIGTTGKIPTVE